LICFERELDKGGKRPARSFFAVGDAALQKLFEHGMLSPFLPASARSISNIDNKKPPAMLKKLPGVYRF